VRSFALASLAVVALATFTLWLVIFGPGVIEIFLRLFYS
jgi:hypothetical protein